MKDKGKKRKRDGGLPRSARHNCAMSSATGDVLYNTCQNNPDVSTLCRRGHEPYESMGQHVFLSYPMLFCTP